MYKCQTFRRYAGTVGDIIFGRFDAIAEEEPLTKVAADIFHRVAVGRLGAKTMKHVAGTDLVYNIVEGLLVGKLDEGHIEARAVSGGRAGSKQGPQVVNHGLANNPFATGVKSKGSPAGGPLPMTKYKLGFDSRPNYIRLVPFHQSDMQGRDPCR